MLSQPKRNVLAISADKKCLDQIIASSLSHTAIARAEHQIDFKPIASEARDVNSLPDIMFIDLTSNRDEARNFLEHLECEYPNCSKHMIVLIDTPNHLDTILDLSMRPCVRAVLNKPLLDLEITNAIDQTLPIKAARP